MNAEQYEHWKNFATRMAKVCYIKSRRPSSAWIVETVSDFFDELCATEIVDIVDWDHSDDWRDDHTMYHSRLVCDTVSEFLDELKPWPPRCRACRDGSVDECRCGEVEDQFHEQWDRQWGDQVRCCIRAGLDTASEPSGGVLGFTAGDVRRMYPEGVSEWVFPPGERLVHWMTREENGTFESLGDDVEVVL